MCLENEDKTLLFVEKMRIKLFLCDKMSKSIDRRFDTEMKEDTQRTFLEQRMTSLESDQQNELYFGALTF